MLTKKENEEFSFLLKRYSARLSQEELGKMSAQELHDIQRLFELRAKKFEDKKTCETSDDDVYYDAIYDRCLTLLASRAVV